jgi:hypothetical protein
VFGEGGQDVTRFDSVRKWVVLADACPLLGERPEIFYLTIAIPVIFWMTCAEILEPASLHENILRKLAYAVQPLVDAAPCNPSSSAVSTPGLNSTRADSGSFLKNLFRHSRSCSRPRHSRAFTAE